MTTTTPYLGLTLYDSSGDQSATFATFRAVLAGTATTSNFYKIDTAMSGFNTRITSLENNAGAISVPMTYISANYYEASGISGITAYNTGATIIVNLDTTSAGTVTLNINSLGTKSLMKIDSSGSPVNIAGTELKKNVRYLFVYDGTRWLWVSQKEKEDGWTDDGNTWTYSSVDGSTGIASVNADMTSTLQKGMRLNYTQAQALTAYWSFDTNSNSDVGSFTATDTAMTYTAGKFSNAATFNGTTSKIVITDASLLKPTGDFTIGAWFKTSTTGTQKQIFASYSLNTNVAGFQLSVGTTNALRFVIGNNTGGTATSNVNYVDLVGTTTVTDNSWHYVVVTYKNSYIQMYLDGRLELSSYSPVPAGYAATNYVRIGCLNTTGTDGQFFNGQIDDVFLINGYAIDEKTIYDKYIAATAQGTGNISLSKMGLITNVGAYSGGNTLITFWGGTDYALVNATISSPRYSNMKSPFGFPLNPEKWGVFVFSVANAQKLTPTASTWYGDTGLSATGISIVVPIGQWQGYYKTVLEAQDTTVTDYNIYSTLSNGSSTQSDTRSTSFLALTVPSGTYKIWGVVSQIVNITVTTKTTYYLNIFTSTSTADAINMRGDVTPTNIQLTSVYL